MDTENRFRPCSLPVCSGERFEFVHRFPNTEERRQAWLDAIGVPLVQLHPRLCGRHFRPEDYVHAQSRSLNRVAVPSLNLKNLNQLDVCKQVRSYKVFDADDPDIVADDDSTLTDRYSNKCAKRTHEEVTQDSDKVLDACKQVHLNMDQSDENQNEYLTINDLEASLLNGDDVMIMDNMENNDEVTLTVGESPITEERSDIDMLKLDSRHVIESSDSSVVLNGKDLLIRHPDYTESLCLDFLWLRDICKCEQCFDESTHSRKCDISEVSVQLQPDMATLLGQNLDIQWNDGHTSSYSLPDLLPSLVPEKPEIFSNQMQWVAKHTTFRDDFHPIRFNDIICSSTVQNNAIDRLQRSGVVHITDICAEAEQKPLIIELLLRRLFPFCVQRLSKEERTDFHSPLMLPHTNCTFLSESCGLQILALSPRSSCADADITLIDGLNAAQQLRSTSRQAFDLLTTFKTNLNYCGADNFVHFIETPVIHLSGRNVERIHFAPYQRGTIPRDNFRKVSEALRKMSKIVADKQHQLVLPLSQNNLIILDNWRICWKVHPVEVTESSNLTLSCVYVDRKDFLSRIHTLQCDQ